MSLLNIPSSQFLDSEGNVSREWLAYLRSIADAAGSLPTGAPGAVLGYTSGGAAVASGALGVNRVVIGGGTTPPTTTATSGTSQTVLHGNASGPPAYGAVNLTTDVTGVLPAANGGSGATGVKVVVIGDSLSAQNILLRDAWPQIFSERMAALDAPVNMVNLAIDACTFYRAVQPPGYAGPNWYVFGTNTMVQECIAQAPQLIFVMLGAADALVNVDSRTTAQQIADATLLFATLRSALPAVKICYVSELPFDSVNFPTGASLVNYAVVPYLFSVNNAGFLSGCIGPDAMPNSINTGGATNQTLVNNWIALDAGVKVLPTIDANFTMNWFRVGRLGCVGPDMLHPSETGSLLESGYIIKGVRGTSFVGTMFPKLANQNYDVWNDPDVLFSDMLTASGTTWVNNEITASSSYNMQDGTDRQLHPDGWMYPWKTKFALNDPVVSNDSASYFSWEMSHGPPPTSALPQLQVSINGGAFSSLGKKTTAEGEALSVGTGFGSAPGVGTYTVRYQCIINVPVFVASPNTIISECYGPFTFTVTAAASPGNYTSMGLTGQLTSTVTTGTAPFVVASTTQVANLNASAVAGVTFPGATTGTAVGTLVLTGKPGANSNSVWGAITVAGVTYDFPVFPR